MIQDTGFIRPNDQDLRQCILSAEANVDPDDILSVLYNEIVKKQEELDGMPCLFASFEVEFKLPAGAEEFLEDLEVLLRNYGWWSTLAENDGVLVSVSIQEMLI